MRSAYHPQSNGLTERFNQTLITQLRKLVNDNQDNWDKIISWILMSYRSNRQESTRFFPYFLVYWIQLRLPIVLETCNVDNPDVMQQSDQYFLESRITRLSNLNSFRMTAICNFNKAQQLLKQQNDSKHQCSKYKISDLVWYKNCRAIHVRVESLNLFG